MKTFITSILLLFSCHLVFADTSEWRHIDNGTIIPTSGMKYVDQPYVITLDDGSWLCMMTVGTLGETIKGSVNYSAALISRDKGRTWSQFIECNRTYALPFKTPAGRIYSLTPMNFTYSDDNAQTWSQKYSIPKLTDKTGWSVGLPLIADKSVILPWAMIGVSNPPRETEVFFLKSNNILTEKDPAKISWELLPKNGKGLQGPDWDKPFHRSEEPHVVQLSNGYLYTVFRTDQGYIAQSISKDKGLTWSSPKKLTYSEQDLRIIKHPLACPSLWKCSNGKYLLFFHNHGEKTYNDRNPAWIAGGIEKNGAIVWSEPDILLYSNDLSEKTGRISYPGFLEDRGKYWIFETQKTIARTHPIPAWFFNELWNQVSASAPTRDGLIVEYKKAANNVPPERSLSAHDSFSKGVAFEIIYTPTKKDGEVVFDTRADGNTGIIIASKDNGTIEITTATSKGSSTLISDQGLLHPEKQNHVVLSLDKGSGVITLMINGKLCNGGAEYQYGWARFTYTLSELFPSGKVFMLPSIKGDISLLRIYDRYLRTSESVGNFKSISGQK